MSASNLPPSECDGRCPDVPCECLHVEKSGAPPTSFLLPWPISHAGLRNKSQSRASESTGTVHDPFRLFHAAQKHPTTETSTAVHRYEALINAEGTGDGTSVCLCTEIIIKLPHCQSQD